MYQIVHDHPVTRGVIFNLVSGACLCLFHNKEESIIVFFCWILFFFFAEEESIIVLNLVGKQWMPVIEILLWSNKSQCPVTKQWQHFQGKSIIYLAVCSCVLHDFHLPYVLKWFSFFDEMFHFNHYTLKFVSKSFQKKFCIQKLISSFATMKISNILLEQS